jgi:hypothetical protein
VDRPVEFQKSLFRGSPKGRAVRVRLSEVGIPRIEVGRRSQRGRQDRIAPSWREAEEARSCGLQRSSPHDGSPQAVRVLDGLSTSHLMAAGSLGWWVRAGTWQRRSTTLVFADRNRTSRVRRRLPRTKNADREPHSVREDPSAVHAHPHPRLHGTAIRSVMSPHTKPASSLATATTAMLRSRRAASARNREHSRSWAAHV